MGNKLTATLMQEADSDLLLTDKVSYIWSEPGTGKTMTMLRAIQKDQFSRIIIVAPPTALGMWEDEFLTQLGIEALVVRGDIEKALEVRGTHGTASHVRSVTKAAEYKYRLDTTRAIVVSYNMAVKNKTRLAAFFTSAPPSGDRLCIIDEAHYCKTPTSQRTAALFGEESKKPAVLWKSRYIAQKVLDKAAEQLTSSAGFAHHADVVWMATGTPRTRWADDLWAQLYFGRKEVLAKHGALTLAQFTTKFCFVKPVQTVKGVFVDRVSGDKNQRLLNALLADCKIIRRTLAEAASELPALTSRLVRVDDRLPAVKLTDEEIEAGITKKDSPIATLFKKLGVAKVPDVVEFVLDNHSGPVLVGFWHTDVGSGLRAALRKERPDWNIVVADGSMLSQDRDLVRKDFNAGKIDVLLGQMEALSTSMNLQEICSHVVMAEQLPSPATWQQFYQRVYRKGQTGHVQLDEVLSDHPIDVAIRRLRCKKAASVDATIGLLGERE